MILSRIAGLHAASGESKSAIELYARAIALAKKANHAALEATTRGSLGRLHFESGNWQAARLELEHALRLFREGDDKRGQALILISLGKLDIATGSDLLRSAAGLFREIGDDASERATLNLLPEPKQAAAPQDKSA
jgi:tetratricopeptide (TPR) repeat protein